MTPGRIAARLLHPLAWHRMDLRGRLMWLAMLPVLVFAVVWGSYVIRQRDADLAAQLQQRAQLLARQLAVAADYGIFSFNQAALDNIALGVLRESSVISATIIAADGRVLATRHAPAQGQAIPPGQLQAMLEASRAEDGCAAYSYAEDVIEPGLIHVFEVWADQAAIDAHFASPHMATWRSHWPSFGVSDRKLFAYEVAAQRPL